jgi:hypothetical protein
MAGATLAVAVLLLRGSGYAGERVSPVGRPTRRAPAKKGVILADNARRLNIAPALHGFGPDPPFSVIQISFFCHINQLQTKQVCGYIGTALA